MSSGIDGSFGMEKAGGEEPAPKTRRTKSPKTEKTDDVAQDAFVSIGDATTAQSRKRERGSEKTPDTSDLKAAKVKERALEPPFAKELADLTPKERDYFMPKVEEALKQVWYDDRENVVEHVKTLLTEDNFHLLPLFIERVAQTPRDERRSLIEQVKTFLAGRRLESYDITDTMIVLNGIAPDQRDEVIRQTLPLIVGIESNIYRCPVLDAVGKLPPEQREDVLQHAKPLFQYFKAPLEWGPLLHQISQIPEESREKVLSQAKEKLPNCSFAAFMNTLKLALARVEAQEKKPVAKRGREEETKTVDSRTQKAVKHSDLDPNRFFQAFVTRAKIRKIVEVANTSKDLPLTREEFEFLSKRSIGLRYSEKADTEFIHGLYGDAVSLSGFPKAQLAFEEKENYQAQWEAHLVHSEDPKEAPQALENRVLTFLSKFINNGFPRYGGDEKTSEYLELLKLTHQVRFLLGNFKDADMPYDLSNYYGIGKCGKQQQARGSDSGRLSKYITLGNEFFDKLNLTQQELDAPIDQVFEKIQQAAIAHVATQVRLHIRKMALLAKALDEGRL